MSYFTSGTEGDPEATNSTVGIVLSVIFWGWLAIDFIRICAGKFKDKHGAVIKNW